MTAIQFSERSSMEEMESCVPPGFRFRPTEEELVGYYLKRKINSLKINLDVIVELDLYKMEPWDLQDRCKLGYKEQNEWYFFSHKDKKYPTGTRTNRATAAGFWKATGRDKAVMSKNRMIGMRKTLVFYKGRAPNGCKTDWIMHEYRLQTSDHAPPQEEGWVVCRAFRKPSPSHHQRQLGFEAQYCYFREQISHARPLSSFADDHHLLLHHPGEATSFSDQPFQQQFMCNHTELIELPQPDDHSPSTACAQNNNIGLSSNEEYYSEERSNEWQSLDSLFASNLTDTVNFFGHSNLPMIPYSHELVQPPQIQASHILGYFPDS